MPKIITLDTAFSDATLPKLQWLDNFESQIRALPGLRAWWDASNPSYYTAAAGKLSKLTDRSGNGFDLVQNTGANQPTLSANFWGSVNGLSRDAASFDGVTDLFMQTASATLFDTTGAWTLVEYFQSNSASANVAFSPNSNNQFAAYINSATQFSGFAGNVSVAVSPVNVRAAVIATMNYPGAGNVAEYLEFNGTSATGSQPLNNYELPAAGLLGSYQAGHGLKFSGSIGEVLLFKSDLTQVAGALATIRAYLAFKYR